MIKYGSNNSWQYEHEEYLRRLQQALADQQARRLQESLLYPQLNSISSAGSVSAGGNTETEPSAPIGGSGTIVFNGLSPVGPSGSYVAAVASDINEWLSSAEYGFTIEWFQKFDQTNSGSFPRVWSIGPDTHPILGVSLEGGLYVWPAGLSGEWTESPDGRWAHVAIIFDPSGGGTLSIYLDGVRKAYGTSIGGSFDFDNSTKMYDLYIGSDGLSANDGFAGNITNFRWVNTLLQAPTELTYPVPTSPLENVPETKLLLLGGSEANPVVDASQHNTLQYRNINWSAQTPFAP